MEIQLPHKFSIEPPAFGVVFLLYFHNTAPCQLHSRVHDSFYLFVFKHVFNIFIVVIVDYES